MRIPLSFKGQSVFVAGGSSGINLGIATAFAQAGAKVAIASRNAERVAQAVEQLRQHGTQIEGYSADVRDAAGIAAALQQARDAIGPFDVLVSGAAGNFLAPALGMSANGFKTVVDIDLNGTFHVLRAGFEQPLHFGMAAGGDVADHDQIRLNLSETFGRPAFEDIDARVTEVVGHRRVDPRVGPHDLMT